MKYFNLKTFIISAIVCLLPILLGIALWDKLPDMVPIHFDIEGKPDNYSSKAFAVFGLPIMMVLLQFLSCYINDYNAYHKGDRVKFTRVVKWIIPVLCVVLQISTFYIALGKELDIRRVAGLLVGLIFILMGNFLPKFDEVRVNLPLSVSIPMDTDKAKKINRFIGFGMVIMGVLFIISLFLPPFATAVCLLLLIPYTLSGIIYAIVTTRRK